MKILIIAENLELDSGWGRYSADLMGALKLEGVNIEFECIPGPMRFKRRILFGWLDALKLFIKYKDKNIDLIHCTVEPYAFITSLLSILLRVPYIITLHGTYAVLFLEHPLYNYFQYHAYKNAKALIAVSHYTKSRVEKYSVKNDIVVVPNGINLPVKATPRELGEKKVLLGIGGLKRRKGFHLVIEALSKIEDVAQNLIYYIVGGEQDPLYAKELRALIKTHSLQERVIMTGRVTEEEKERLYNEADLFILTPVSEGLRFEGFGLVYLEANARGVPVIATMGSGAEEAVKNGYNGLLANESDPSDIALKVKEMLSDPIRYSEVSGNALEWAQKMQWSNNVKRYLDIYDSKRFLI